jgi:hypothetical protein
MSKAFGLHILALYIIWIYHSYVVFCNNWLFIWPALLLVFSYSVFLVCICLLFFFSVPIDFGNTIQSLSPVGSYLTLSFYLVIIIIFMQCDSLMIIYFAAVDYTHVIKWYCGGIQQPVVCLFSCTLVVDHVGCYSTIHVQLCLNSLLLVLASGASYLFWVELNISVLYLPWSAKC